MKNSSDSKLDTENNHQEVSKMSLSRNTSDLKPDKTAKFESFNRKTSFNRLNCNIINNHQEVYQEQSPILSTEFRGFQKKQALQILLYAILTAILISNLITGIVQKNFEWTKSGNTFLISAGLHLITFGASYTAGSIIGLALTGSSLTNLSLKAIRAVGGALAGGGVRVGTYILTIDLDDNALEAHKLILEGISGMIWLQISEIINHSNSSDSNTETIFKRFNGETSFKRIK